MHSCMTAHGGLFGTAGRINIKLRQTVPDLRKGRLLGTLIGPIPQPPTAHATKKAADHAWHTQPFRYRTRAFAPVAVRIRVMTERNAADSNAIREMRW